MAAQLPYEECSSCQCEQHGCKPRQDQMVRCIGPKWSARSTDDRGDRGGLADDDLAVQCVGVQGRPKRSNSRRLRTGGAVCGISQWGRGKFTLAASHTFAPNSSATVRS